MPIGIYKRKKPVWNKGLKVDKKIYPSMGHHKNHSPEAIKKMKKARLGKSAYWNKGNKSPNWKGGITPINKQIRFSLEYKLWRRSVFERDKYTCIWCGQKGGTLNADHIKPFALFPELRFSIDNGRTLCVPCHKTTDTYGKRN